LGVFIIRDKSRVKEILKNRIYFNRSSENYGGYINKDVGVYERQKAKTGEDLKVLHTGRRGGRGHLRRGTRI
jgi:hypothetical protein